MEHEIPVLPQLLLVLAVSVPVVYLFQALRVPTVVGFLLSGVLIGPGGLELVHERESIRVLAEIGVALLLFSIGLEFSLRDLLRMRLTVFGGGSAQVLLTTAGAALLLGPLGLPAGPAVFAGALVALSSTAIVLKLLGDRGEAGSAHGRTMLSILIFQDLAIVPLMLLAPLLGGRIEGWREVAIPLGTAALVVVGMLTVATYAVPRLMERIVRARSRELFTLTTLVIALGTAYLTARAGLSLALGAFMAGMVISESEYSNQVMSEIAPLRDAFNSLFFVSVGMLMDPMVALERPALVLGLLGGVVLLKAFVAGAVAVGLGLGLRVAALVGLSLAQVGEFSFLLAHVGLAAGLISDEHHRLFLVVTVTSMLLTPLLLPLGHRLAPLAERITTWASASWLSRPLAGRQRPPPAPEPPLSDHVLVIGYGVNGRNVARILRQLEVPYVVLELNLDVVRRRRSEGEPISHGDATRRAVLEHLGVARARAVVVAISDPAASRQIVALARELNPEAVIIVRVRLVHEVDPLYALGASEVVPEEFETSLELVSLVMATYGAGAHVIEREKARIRRERYTLLRGRSGAPTTPPEREPLAQLLAEVDVDALEVDEACWARGHSLRELDLRARTGASILAIARGDDVHPNPNPDLQLASGDRLVAVGRGEQIEAARELLCGPDPRGARGAPPPLPEFED